MDIHWEAQGLPASVNKATEFPGEFEQPAFYPE
jgi:hypothetical protein